MKRNFLILILMMCILNSPCFASKKGRVVNAVINEHVKLLKNKYHLTPRGLGSRIPDDVKGFILDFSGPQKLNLDQARILFVEVIENLLIKINSSKELRPFMYQYPFDSNNIEYMMVFNKPSGRHVDKEYISFIFNQDGKIYYKSYDHEKDEYIPRHIETYEEALRIVQGSM